MLSEKIKELRLARDMSQEDLSEILDVTRQSISKYENGTSEPSLDKIALIVDYFDVTFDYLLDNAVAVDDFDYGKAIEPVEEATSEAEKTQAEKLHERKTKEIEDLPRIEIHSKIEPEGETHFYKFTISEKFPHVDYKPTALLSGVHSRTFLFENRTDLAWYLTMEDAEKELEAIEEALDRGDESYELQYDVPVKKRGFFSVQLTEEDVASDPDEEAEE